MPYYGAGDYYGQGDYYAAGGIFGSIGKFIGGAVKTVAKAGAGFLTGGPVGALGAVIGPSIAPRAPGTALVGPMVGPGTAMSFPEPGITGFAHRTFAGGKPGYGRLKKDGSFTDRRRPRMNVANVRALKRAGRRVRGFLKIASRLGALPISRGGSKKLFRRKRK